MKQPMYMLLTMFYYVAVGPLIFEGQYFLAFASFCFGVVYSYLALFGD